jgi:hypothetical protein
VIAFKRLRRVNWANASNGLILAIATLFLLALFLSIMVVNQIHQPGAGTGLTLLTDPFLQLPTANSVRVVWFTEFEGDRHWVRYGKDLQQTAATKTTKLSRIREDQKSRVGAQTQDQQRYQTPELRNIWRHEAEITGLTPGQRQPYQVGSSQKGQGAITSSEFSLAPLPPPGQALKILLTSDHQLKPMTPANLQKVVETVGQLDAVFFAGDLVGIPDRASEWFDDNRGGAFFPSLQGRAQYDLESNGVTTRYRGGAIIQNAPLFPAIGNHEVMGRFSMKQDLNRQFGDPAPKAIAEQRYHQSAATINPQNDPAVQQAWIKDNSFNTDTYEELFTLPDTGGGKRYYAVTIGDVRLISLYVTNIWRVPSLDANARGKYRERDDDLDNPERWGYGQHIFEPITPGSPQYTWLQAELDSPDFLQAKYRVVMFHHPLHSLGDNIVPAYTNPVQAIDRDTSGQIKAVRYEYPIQEDYLIRDVIPLLEATGVQLVFYGHCHVWNRFVSPGGAHFLESSNVGNTYGAFMGKKRRPIPIGFANYYAATGDPNGLEPVMPTIAPLTNDDGQAIPYIASDDITAFSILDTGTGIVSSYRFDTREPNSPVVKFDEFQLSQ